ncbi:ABC transporter permease subunit [Alkalibaculum sp. M08DMB]|uniref:ABC transporter permease subunit n=1 Tax=Alkalibaculum sporogenes TaxID=2655001 RepID=A0A6A7K828_9FIRM|nr:ABC transporter permease subunit [Alkalibaculum sporogenes]MPW25545.1 ABC transporter permease subunit [Alkalibaculum sporogenes]
MKKINLILKKELRTTLRDKKTLITILIPILIYPILLIFYMGFSQVVQSDLTKNESLLAVDNNVPHDFLVRLEDDPIIRVSTVSPNVDYQSLEDINARISFKSVKSGEMYTVHYNSTLEPSQQSANRIEEHFRDYEETIKSTQLKEANIDYEFENVVTIQEEEISGDMMSRVIAMALGLIFPLLIVLYGIIGTYTISSDLSAGEKDRETLETIFSVPIKRFEVIIGKLLACVIVGLLSGMINILALFPLAYAITTNIPELSISISFPLFLYLFLMLIPIMILTSAVFIGIGFISKTYQESQSYGSVLFIGFIALCYIPLVPNLEASSLTLSIPITNALLLMKEAFLGSYSLIDTIKVLGINLAVSGIGIYVMNKLFQSDWVVFGGKS